MPSRSANSIHVARMCEALGSLGHEPTLFFCRSVPGHKGLRQALEEYYGVDLGPVQLVSSHDRSGRGINLRIAGLVIRKFFTAWLFGKLPALIISRNLYASFVVGVVFRCRMVFETHQVQRGFRGALQRAILRRRWIVTVVISDALERILRETHGVAPAKTVVLRDAAPATIQVVPSASKGKARAAAVPTVDLDCYRCVAGYFGHLYPGRGIEIIRELAERHADTMFLVFGGNEADIHELRAASDQPNVAVMGFVKPADTVRTMALMDVLLMPYQQHVSFGVKDEDTGRWMSPMKMFEYMASEVPIIASRLPALQEVLRDGHNSLLATPDDPAAWSECLTRLRADAALGQRLASVARHECIEDHNWTARATRMMDLVAV